MEKRTYEEAVEITVKWWSEKTFDTPNNQNNGDGLQSMMLNMLRDKASENLPDTAKSFFEVNLRTILLTDKDNKSNRRGDLSIDYNPSKMLYDACLFAGVNTSMLPIKTFTYINENNEVEGRYQIGGELFTL